MFAVKINLGYAFSFTLVLTTLIKLSLGNQKRAEIFSLIYNLFLVQVPKKLKNNLQTDVGKSEVHRLVNYLFKAHVPRAYSHSSRLVSCLNLLSQDCQSPHSNCRLPHEFLIYTHRQP